MPKSQPKVYLDHLIKRDNLFYRRKPAEPAEEKRTRSGDYLNISDLYGQRTTAPLLRKPDFQRATWAWTPEECVELLEAVLQVQVVPSVIMWLSPDMMRYVLDGGHRISVLLAWINDDWGDRSPPSEYKDQARRQANEAVAKEVRKLLQAKRIGAFQDFIDADERYWRLQNDENKSPDQHMSTQESQYATQVREWRSVDVGFPILWVKGDYEKAEQSFLKINKSGRRLSEWETKLVENRSSSFARVVMSAAHVSNAKYCWPTEDNNGTKAESFNNNVDKILTGIQELHSLLFEPEYSQPIVDVRQPLLAIPSFQPELKPAYLAELLTIVEGKKGQKPETAQLIARDRLAMSSDIVVNGNTLVRNALDVLKNIRGSSPRSLTLVPLVYFYNNHGRYVRSLLYGMVYWLNHGSDSTDVINRKLLFAAHRKAFEEVLLKFKEVIIARIARRIGSGPEVTSHTARYFNGLLSLLITHKDDIESALFLQEHQNLIETLDGGSRKQAEARESSSSNRVFVGKARSGVNTQEFIRTLLPCGICQGRFVPGDSTQVDHVLEHSRGGKTRADNGRNTHPFCNNNRARIEALIKGTQALQLPAFENPAMPGPPVQLTFLSLFEDPEDIDDENDLEEVAPEESSGNIREDEEFVEE